MDILAALNPFQKAKTDDPLLLKEFDFSHINEMASTILQRIIIQGQVKWRKITLKIQDENKVIPKFKRKMHS